jgi:manganese transport protein
VSGIFDLTLGVISSMGGFIDIGELVFLAQAGSKFAYSLLWVIVLGTISIMVYGEMAGRVAAITGSTVFDVVRQKFPRPIGIIALAFSLLVTLVTCAAEIGGLGLLAQLAFGWPFWIGTALAAVLLIPIIFLSPFEVLENVFGVGGVAMLVFMAALFLANVDWAAAATGLLPSIPQGEAGAKMLLYGYFVVGIFSSVMMPYEIFFYSSGAVEQKWRAKDLLKNTLVSGLGFAFGSLVAMSLLVNSAAVLALRGIDPQLLGATMLQAVFPFGMAGLVLALVGVAFALFGATIETSLSAAYITCQYFNLPWGKAMTFGQAPLFNTVWIATLGLALAIALIGPEPMQTAEYAVIFSALALPLSYFAVLLAGNDRKLMGRHVNSMPVKVAATAILFLVILAGATAIPLMIATSAGEIF